MNKEQPYTQPVSEGNLYLYMKQAFYEGRFRRIDEFDSWYSGYIEKHPFFHPSPINYERFPEELNPYELSDLLAGIRQLTTDLANEHVKRELTFHEKQRLDLLLDNMNWELPAPKAEVWTHERVKHFAEWIGEAGYENYTTFDQWRKELDKEPFDKPHWPFSTEGLIKEYLNQKS